MKYTKETIYLKDGQIEIWDGQTLIGTTDIFLHKHVGSIQLDRKEFVKPVDVEKEANNWADSECPSPYEQWGAKGYIAAMEANPNEFTRGQIIDAMKYASSHLSSLKGIMDYIDSIGALRIPESVTIENNQVIEVKW